MDLGFGLRFIWQLNHHEPEPWKESLNIFEFVVGFFAVIFINALIAYLITVKYCECKKDTPPYPIEEVIESLENNMVIN
jgi:hypothetical protein